MLTTTATTNRHDRRRANEAGDDNPPERDETGAGAQLQRDHATSATQPYKCADLTRTHLRSNDNPSAPTLLARTAGVLPSNDT